jgi:serine/threonine protein phosphatase PrpC
MEQNGFTIWSEKIIYKGEDALPTTLTNNTDQKFVFAVYDGMGGAGSAIYNYEEKPVSGAYIAANETKKYFEKQVNEYLNGRLQIAEIKTSIEIGLFHHLQSVANSVDKNPSRLKSNLIKRLPTTIAAIFCDKNLEQQEKRNLTCMWAGDSRCYVLSPENGLNQLTNDDLKGDNDALRNLRSDAPMSNYCNADVAFKINVANCLQEEPFILLTATDGCFGYLPSPFHFEHLLLKTLMDETVKCFDEWKKKITEEIQKITGDDYSMTLSCFGFTSFEEVQAKFEIRNEMILSEYIKAYERVSKPIEQLETSLENAKIEKENTLNQLWNEYKVKYQTNYAER